MRAKAIAAVLALGVALLTLPADAAARPGALKLPGGDSSSMFARSSHGYFVYIAVLRGHAFLLAERSGEDGGDSLVTYSRSVSGQGGRLHFGLGRAGEIDVRLVVEKVQEVEPTHGCTGGPTVTRNGHFVGKIDFHPPGGFTGLDLHRMRGAFSHQAPLVCRGRFFLAAERAAHRREAGIRRLIAGDPDGRRQLEVGTYPRLSSDEPVIPSFTASLTRSEGSLTITERASALSSPDSSTFGVPALQDLPATVTVEPAAPFSGSATFDLPSRRMATFSGDLAVELPEVGTVPLTGPKIAAGLCRGYVCTKSLPKALRPQHSGSGFIFVTSVSGPPGQASTK